MCKFSAKAKHMQYDFIFVLYLFVFISLVTTISYFHVTTYNSLQMFVIYIYAFGPFRLFL